MGSLNPDSYLERYNEVTQALDEYVYQLVNTPELVPASEFDRVNNLIIQSEPPRQLQNPFIVPELLNAKVTFARALIEMYEENFDEAERCLESALYYADTVDMRATLLNWIEEGVTNNTPLKSQLSPLLENAVHTISFDTASTSTTDWEDNSEVSMFLIPDPLRFANLEESGKTFSSHVLYVDAGKLSAKIDILVSALSKSADSGLILEIFNEIDQGLKAASRGERLISLEDLGLLDARHHVVAALIESPENPNASREALREARERAEYWGKLDDLNRWIEETVNIHPQLAERIR